MIVPKFMDEKVLFYLFIINWETRLAAWGFIRNKNQKKQELMNIKESQGGNIIQQVLYPSLKL